MIRPKLFFAGRISAFAGCFVVVIGVVIALSSAAQPTQAATNSTVNFQARLMTATGTIVPDGNYNVEFKLYDAASSSGSSQGSCTGDSACLWAETRTTTDRVRVVNGYLTVNLGSVTALPAIDWDQQLWLTMNIGGTAVSPAWDGEMSPRLTLTATPYAFTAGQLATTNGSFRSTLSFVQPTANRSIQAPDESGTICIQGSSACGFATGSAANFIQNQNSVNQTADFRISGTGRANTSIMTPLLQPTVDGTTALKIQNIAATVTALAADTTNGRITIGANTAATETLDVVGNLQVRDAVTATKSYRLRTSGGALDFESSGADLHLSTWSGAGYAGTQYNQIIFRANGASMDFARGFNVSDAAARVGLGGNVNPQYTLDVTGDVNTSTQYRIGGVVICTATGCAPAAGSNNYIQNTTVLQNANMAVQAAASGSVAAVLQANAAGTADILQLNNGAGTAVATFGYSGSTLFKNSTNSTTAFQVQNAAGTGVLVVDTTNQRVAIGNVAPALKFEVQGGDAAIYNSGNNARLVLGDSATSGQHGYLQWDSTNDYFRIEKNGTNGVKINDNFVSIGNIFPSKPLIVGNGTDALFEVATTGQIESRTATNTATAFQIQNDVGDVYFNGDSLNMRVGIGDGMITPEVTLDVSGAIQQTGLQTSDTGAGNANKWTKLGTCTLVAQFSQCLTKLEIMGGSDGSAGNNGQATVTARIKQQNALGGVPYVNITLNDTAEVITKSDIVAVTTVNNGTTTTVELYGRITNTFENWYYTPVMNTGGFGESTWDWSPFSGFIAALPAGVQEPARYGNVNANLFAVEATNATAVKIQNAGAANTLFVADTQNLRVAIGQAAANYTLDVLGDVNTSTQYRIGGTAVCTATGCTASAASAIQNQNATNQTADFRISGTGRANTALQAPLVDTATAVALNIGTTNATAINIGGATTTTTFGGGLVDLGSSGTVQGAGLSSDCSGQYNKLLWSSSTKRFSCGTDRSSYTVIKAANQTKNADTTYVNATDLSFPVGANETWIFEAHLSFNAPATPDIKFDLTAPTGTVCDMQKVNLNAGISGAKYTCSGGAKPDFVMDGGGGFDASEVITGSLVTSSTAGTAQLRFAQNVSNASNTVLYAGSWIVAYKVSGADVAEIYYAKDTTLEAGDVVTVDGSLKAGVKKTDTAYDPGAVGVVSTKPGLVLGDPATGEGGKPVLLALSGRVPVKVSTENGPIKAGDFLTPSAKHPGYAMKATRAGYTIGQALDDYKTDKPGTVLMFSRLGYYPGSTDGLQGSDTDMEKLNVKNDATINGNLQVNGQIAITSDSKRAFTIQDAMGNTTFGVNNQDRTVYIGKPGGSARPTLLIVGSKTTKGDPKGKNGAIYYNEISDTFRCYEKGSWKNCANGSGMSYNTEIGGTPIKLSKPEDDTVFITPLYVPGRIVVNEMRAFMSDLPDNGKGDIGIYDTKGRLVLGGGRGSIDNNGLQMVEPSQKGQARILEPGQYFMAVTWEGSGKVTGVRLPYSGLLKRNGAAAGGGAQLPSSINLKQVSETATVPGLSANN